MALRRGLPPFLLRVLLLLPVLLLAEALGPLACREFGPRVYTAHPYRAAESCVAASVPIAIVQADDLPVTCAPVCLLLDETLYVSPVCEPYPSRATLLEPAFSADCASALALLAQGRLCEPLSHQLAAAGSSDAGPADSSAP